MGSLEVARPVEEVKVRPLTSKPVSRAGCEALGVCTWPVRAARAARVGPTPRSGAPPTLEREIEA